ncbi:non-ribosomal peptide synthetase [Penicillium sp. DV-2018c]|nr:non-ribosomal peptide synthetase [Penicillium sp. DV-2018c]KAJ5582932.1 non-ribosomal peptide synthetase [Penicillium sp. DV-2018c]
MISYADSGEEPPQAKLPNVHVEALNDVDIANEYWEELFQQAGPQRPLPCFPIEYQEPRCKTTLTIPDGLFEATLWFCKKYNVCLHHVFYGVWAIVSARHMADGQRTTVFTVADRDHPTPGQDEVIRGPDHDFPLVLTLPQDMEVLPWIRHVGTVCAEASSHAHVGYKNILEKASAHDPQVKVSISLPGEGQEAVGAGDEFFPLVLDIRISTNLKLSLWHNSTVPERDIRVILDHVASTLQETMDSYHHSSISAFRIMSPKEKRLLQEFASNSGLMHRLIEQQARLTPDAEAVQFEQDEPLTYSMLNTRSNQLALLIRSFGAPIVPVHMHTSINFIIALLAILKAGSAYVILDPNAGAARRSYIIKDVQADFILVDDNTAGEFYKEFNVGDLLSQSTTYDGSDLMTDQRVSDLAYIIYTSGSSGNPKAVQLEHQAAFSGLKAFPRIANLRQLLFYNPVFSAAQRSIWATLSVGGCLCLASKENITVHLATTINTMQINSIDMTSTTASLISPDEVPLLRRLVLGGEMVSSTVIQRWAHRVELFSSYGLSECTQLNWRCRLSSDSNPRNIGQPSDTTTSYILIPGTVKFSPLLVPGELCLGGAQLARGYLNLPEETKKRFIDNPFGHGRLYRTGDMAVRHADGSIEMMGRIDFQVKINGQRIDPGEPNSVIQAHEDIEQSAVVPVSVKGKMLLVGVVVSRAECEWDPLVENLRSFLQSRVPSYMVPSFWVSIPAMPLNANGKIDMQAVRDIVERHRDSGQLLPHRSKTETNGSALTQDETIVRKLWAELLSMPESDISLGDSFVSLGGTSLEAIQVVSRLRSEHSLNLKVDEIILGTSLSAVARLAEKLDEGISMVDRMTPFALLREPLSPGDLNIELSEIEDAYPVTPFQEAAIANTVMGDSSYIYSRSYSFAGHDEALVKAALESLAKSHALLRTTFVVKGASFLQVVKKAVDLPWESSTLDVKDFMKHRASDLMYPGDLWWRAAVLPGSVLVLTTHHALFDYWSNEFFSQDLTSLLLGNEPIQRPAYRRYVEHLQQSDDNAMAAFWSNYLDGAKPSPLGPYGSRESPVTAKLSFDFQSAASKLRVTPSVLLYAAWSVVLSIAGSTGDVVFGVTLSGRDAPVPGILEMTGPTLMIAPLRVKVDKAESFESHLKSVQDNLWGVAKNAQYGLRRILKTSGQPKDLVGSMVNFLIKPPVPRPAGGLVLLSEKNLGSVENVKIEINKDTMDCVTLVSSLDEEFAQALVDTVAIVLESASSAPLTEIGHWNLVQPITESAGDLGFEDPQSQLMEVLPSQAENGLVGSDEGDRIQSPSRAHLELAHAAFQRMAASHPAKIAVQDASGNQITYAGLAIKANQLAGLLRVKGIQLEQIVPIMFEKSINTVVAEFGILVAGGAFLPLGPENPRERNLGILDDLDGKIAITDRASAAFFVDTAFEVIVLDDLEWDAMPIERHDVPGLTPDSLAYVIYTSGSTGKPKGTLLTHGGVSVAAQAINEATETKISHRFLWVPNYTFDGSLDTLFTALSSGCTLCVAPQSVITSNLTGLINSMQVNRANMTPSMTALISPAEVPTFGILITGGEAITPQVLATWMPRVKIYNAYGPTEATISITTTRIHPDMNLRNVGRPFKDVTALVLDPETTNAVPPGGVGELCLAGPQVARGYLKRPDATARAFVDTPEGRIYRTGDLARILPNGDIELFGRKDDQVKINGYRIELGEIENVVMRTSMFDTCIVICPTVLKKKQLVAFYSKHVGEKSEARSESDLLLPPGQLLDLDQLKSQLTTIPSYMIPTIWLPVNKFPFSAAGKVDRKRLQALVEGMADDLLKQYLPKEVKSAITTETELKLQTMWSELFEISIDQIHANSSFHALGGDSISALNLVSMLRRQGYETKVSDLLSQNTLRQQAALLEESIKSDTTVTTQTVQYEASDAVWERLSQIGVPKDEVEDIYPCSPGQIEFLTQGNKQEQFWQLMAVRELPKDFDFDRWIQLTTKLTQNSQILRALYVYEQEANVQTALQVVVKSPTLNLRYKSFDTEEEKQQILAAEWEELFDRSKPFVRYTCLVNTGDGTKHLVIKLDHASYDGTLLHIFDDQFKALDKDLPIPRHTPFKDFIGHILSTPKQPQLDYWVHLLENKNFDFPSNVVHPKLSKIEVAKVSTSVGIDNLASSNGVTVPIVFQTAFSLLLAHMSGTRDVIYDNLITGRNVPLDNPQLIDGNCANFLPFLGHLAKDQPIESLLRDTQADFWTSTENGLVSLGEIYNALGCDRSTSAAKCLFCFQPFEAAPIKQDPMRWIVMKMSKNTMFFNYAIQLEVVRTATKGEYMIRFGYDGRAFTDEEARVALDWYVGCLGGMATGTLVEELGM